MTDEERDATIVQLVEAVNAAAERENELRRSVIQSFDALTPWLQENLERLSNGLVTTVAVTVAERTAEGTARLVVEAMQPAMADVARQVVNSANFTLAPGVVESIRAAATEVQRIEIVGDVRTVEAPTKRTVVRDLAGEIVSVETEPAP